jgi:hypothetical protein
MNHLLLPICRDYQEQAARNTEPQDIPSRSANIKEIELARELRRSLGASAPEPHPASCATRAGEGGSVRCRNMKEIELAQRDIRGRKYYSTL